MIVLSGDKCEFIINTCGAGAGTLGIQIDGPSKVKLDVTEIGEGYKCVYVPTHPGEYMITIKYGGPTHITGSPFMAKITGKLMLFILTHIHSSMNWNLMCHKLEGFFCFVVHVYGFC